MRYRSIIDDTPAVVWRQTFSEPVSLRNMGGQTYRLEGEDAGYLGTITRQPDGRYLFEDPDGGLCIVGSVYDLAMASGMLRRAA